MMTIEDVQLALVLGNCQRFFDPFGTDVLGEELKGPGS
jgi:hypothetical protein